MEMWRIVADFLLQLHCSCQPLLRSRQVTSTALVGTSSAFCTTATDMRRSFARPSTYHRAAGVTDSGLVWTSATNTYSKTEVRFHPGGRTPVLPYGSKWTLRWQSGSFTCTSAVTGVTCLVRGVRLAGFRIDRNGIKRLPAPTTTSTAPDYITADEMEATFEEKGLVVQGRHFSWLQVACLGQGVPRGTAFDRSGIAEDKYHLFQCTGTLSNNRTALVHVEIFASPWESRRIPLPPPSH